MNQTFLQRLIDKPQSYLLAWAYFYAHADSNGVFVGNAPLLQSRFGVSRSSLQRIVDYGCEWAESGQKVGRFWANNELKLTNLWASGGQILGRKWAESGQITEHEEGQETEPKTPKKRTKKPVEAEPVKPITETPNDITIQPKKNRQTSQKLYPRMVEVYNEFCQTIVGMGAKMDAHQGKCMKSIIEYLKIQVINKIGADDANAVEENILKAWQYILNNWSKVNGYYKEQIKLSQIDSNLPVILMQLKQTKTNKRDEQYANTKSEIGRTSFE